MKQKNFLIAILGLLTVLFAYNAIANPAAPNNIAVLNSTYREWPSTGTDVPAQAGNVTLMVINDMRSTHRWQGYYGNVSGGITLDDAAGNTLFDWNLARPRGEIYASNTSTVTWSRIQCFNMSAVSGQQAVTITDLETTLGMGISDKDGVNETFNYTFAGSFSVGLTSITSGSGCSAVYTYKNDAAQTTDFIETVLTDNTTTGNVIYTAILEDDITGFDGQAYDFQMIVGENGDVTGTTTYYFFVELE